MLKNIKKSKRKGILKGLIVVRLLASMNSNNPSVNSQFNSVFVSTYKEWQVWTSNLKLFLVEYLKRDWLSTVHRMQNCKIFIRKYHCQQACTTLRIPYVQMGTLKTMFMTLTVKQQNPYLKRISILLKVKRKSEFTY